MLQTKTRGQESGETMPHRIQKAFPILIGLTIFSLIGCSQNTQKRPTSLKVEKHPEIKGHSCAGSSASNAVRRRVSVVPQFSAKAIHAAYWPVLTKIGEKSNLCFELNQQQSIPEFEDALRNKKPDYAFMNPYHQVMFADSYKPLLRDKNKLLTGIIVTNSNNTADTIDDLEGRDLLLPAPNAFGASLLTRAFLDQQGIKVRPRYVKTHQNVYRGVARDQSVAGGGVNKTYQRESNDLQGRVKILAETPGYPAHPFSASKSIPSKESEMVQELWIEMAKDPDLQPLLEKVQIPSPMRADYQKDYAPLADLGLERFVK